MIAFRPQGFLIVTRPMFVGSLDDYVHWKHSIGFQVYVVTAEWIQSHVPGTDIRIKIRNCLRHYWDSTGAKYALLIGDSVDIPENPSATTYQEPAVPDLSESWNLPAGYYRLDNQINPQYTTLFYSDFTDKVYYGAQECEYKGDYRICVGVIPVRQTSELVCVLEKIIKVNPTKQITFDFSENFYDPSYAPRRLQEIQALAPRGISITSCLFTGASTDKDVYQALFSTQGMIQESGHGMVDSFQIGSTTITKSDAARFQYINPLYMTASCSVQAYHLGDCLDEAFLRMAKGPAALSTFEPIGYPIPPRTSLVTTKRRILEGSGFWEDDWAGFLQS